MALRDELEKRKQEQQNLQNEMQNLPPLTAPQNTGVQVPIQEPDFQNRQGRNLLDVVQEYGKPYDFNQELQQAERARKLGTFMDALSMAGEGLTAAMGRRQFVRPAFASTQPAAMVEKLRNAKTQQNINHQNILRDAAARQYNFDITDKRYQDRVKQNEDAEKRRMLELERLTNKDAATQAIKEKELGLKVEKEGVAQKNKDRDYELRKGLGYSRLNLQKENAKFNREYKEKQATNKANSGSTGANQLDAIVDADDKRIEYPKYMSKAVSGYLYNRMKEIVSAGDAKGRNLDDLQLTFGEGGDQLTKMESIVKRRLRDFPELTEELEQIINQGYKTGEPKDTKPIPSISQQQVGEIERIIDTNPGDEIGSIRQIATYLKAQGFNQDEIRNILKTIQ